MRLFLSALLLLPCLLQAEAFWPEFRGPTGQGHSTATGLPLTWSKTQNVQWKRELPGRAWSQPIVIGSSIYLTNAVSTGTTTSLRVTALNAATGETLWDTPIFEVTDADKLKMHAKNSHASPTPLFEDKKIYAHFGHHGTACVSDAGAILWSTQEQSYSPVHGTGGSPVIFRDLLIFNADGKAAPAVIALDKASGKLRWRTARESAAARKFSFSTPLLIEVNGQTQLLTPGSGILQALDPKDGSPLWHIFYDQGYSVVPRPVFANGLVVICTGYDKPRAIAVRPDGKGDVTATHIAWTADKRVPHNPSILVVDNELYMLDDKGILSSRDCKTGTVHYEERLLGQSSASLLFADGHIYAIDEQGKAAVVQPGKTLKVLATNDLAEKTLSSMAVCESDLLIRTEGALYRIGKRS
jgi:outer membrane protein assembly factor BamB